MTNVSITRFMGCEMITFGRSFSSESHFRHQNVTDERPLAVSRRAEMIKHGDLLKELLSLKVWERRWEKENDSKWALTFPQHWAPSFGYSDGWFSLLRSPHFLYISFEMEKEETTLEYDYFSQDEQTCSCLLQGNCTFWAAAPWCSQYYTVTVKEIMAARIQQGLNTRPGTTVKGLPPTQFGTDSNTNPCTSSPNFNI